MLESLYSKVFMSELTRITGPDLELTQVLQRGTAV